MSNVREYWKLITAFVMAGVAIACGLTARVLSDFDHTTMVVILLAVIPPSLLVAYLFFRSWMKR